MALTDSSALLSLPFFVLAFMPTGLLARHCRGVSPAGGWLAAVWSALAIRASASTGAGYTPARAAGRIRPAVGRVAVHFHRCAGLQAVLPVYHHLISGCD